MLNKSFLHPCQNPFHQIPFIFDVNAPPAVGKLAFTGNQFASKVTINSMVECIIGSITRSEETVGYFQRALFH